MLVMISSIRDRCAIWSAYADTCQKQSSDRILKESVVLIDQGRYALPRLQSLLGIVDPCRLKEVLPFCQYGTVDTVPKLGSCLLWVEVELRMRLRPRIQEHKRASTSSQPGNQNKNKPEFLEIATSNTVDCSTTQDNVRRSPESAEEHSIFCSRSSCRDSYAEGRSWNGSRII